MYSSDSDYYSEEEEPVCVCNNFYECQCVELIINKRRFCVVPTTTTKNKKPKPVSSTPKPVIFSSSTKIWSTTTPPSVSLTEIMKQEELFKRQVTSIMHHTNELVGATSRYLMCNAIIKGLKCEHKNCSFAHTYDSIIPLDCKTDCGNDHCGNDHCVYLHSYETHEQFYARLEKSHKIQREEFVKNRPYIMCKRLIAYGKCPNRTRCKFAHAVKELFPKICKFKYNCNRIKTCPFLHHQETKEELVKRLNLTVEKAPSKMCRAYLKNKNKKDCKRFEKGKCSFAHDFSELKPNACRAKIL